MVPFTVLDRLKSGALETSEWLMFCQSTRIGVLVSCHSVTVCQASGNR